MVVTLLYAKNYAPCHKSKKAKITFNNGKLRGLFRFKWLGTLCLKIRHFANGCLATWV